jgi:hypothetical protein
MGIVGATDLVAIATEAKHVASVTKWKNHYLAYPPEAAEDYIATHSAWWSCLLNFFGFNDELLGAIAAREERRTNGN